MAGDNVRFRIYRITTPTDDIVGGAQVSGTVAYDQVQGRFQSQKVSQLLLQQGLETEHIFTARLIPGTLIIYERDELEVVEPPDHLEHGHRFRIIDVRPSDHNPRDPRNYVLLDLVRSIKAHKNQ